MFKGTILRRQLDKQVALGCDPRHLSHDELAEYIRTNALCAVKELMEVLDEYGWKPWGKSKHFNRKNYAEEIADVLLFVDNLKLALLNQETEGYQWTHPNDLEERFVGLVHAKIENTLAREASGEYEGFTQEDNVH